MMAIDRQRGALDAVDTLTIKRQCGRYAWGVEADITKCFDTIDHDGIVRMGAERIEDGALRRLMRKGLKAGVLDTDGTGRNPVTGPHKGARCHRPCKGVPARRARCVVRPKWSNGPVEAQRSESLRG